MTQAALPRCMAIPIDWKRKDLERRSPLMLLILFPRSSRNLTACGPNGPKVSAPIGMKWKSVRCRYLWIFRSSACSAVLQGSSADVWQYVAQTVSTTVKSQAKGFSPS